MSDVSFYREEYPRPQFVRKSFVDLNGKWDFAFDDQNVGKKEKWYREHSFEQKILVPYSYQTEKSGINDSTRHDILWYSRELDYNAQGEKRFLINFEGVDFDTEFWVNSEFIGRHEGGYERFSFDITDSLKNGKNNLTLRVEDCMETSQPRGKQRWTEKSLSCFYVETSGIWKSVWAEEVSPSHIERVEITPLVDSDGVSFAAEFNRIEEGLTLDTTVNFDKDEVFRVSEILKRKRISFSHSLISESTLFKINYWTPYCPLLYEVKFTLRVGSKILDEVYSYFGMRKIEISGKQILVNNAPEYFRGVLDQGYWNDTQLTPPDGAALKKDVELIKEMGFNSVRVHEKTEDERFYYFCDTLGLYATCEMPSEYEFSAKGSSYLMREWREVVSQYQNHPSIVCWIPFNESWGVFQVANDPLQQQLTVSLCAIARTLDAQHRPVISNDGWEHTDSDIITLHSYLGDPEALSATIGDTDSYLAENRVTNNLLKAIIANGYPYKGQPLMVTEYGGVAYVKDADNGWGYGKMAENEDEFIKRIADLTEVIKNQKGFCGYCFTQLTDVQQEVNGLLTIDREYKADRHKLNRIFS